jgi:hypothetical protein
MTTRAHSFGLSIALLLNFLTAACAPSSPYSPPLAPAAPLQVSLSDRLYFGRTIPGGGTVSEAEWTAFLRDVITPRFPAGLTVWRAEGQWRDSSGAIVREDSFVLELIHAADARSDRAIEEIVAAYKQHFRQDAVLRVQSRVRVRY